MGPIHLHASTVFGVGSRELYEGEDCVILHFPDLGWLEASAVLGGTQSRKVRIRPEEAYRAAWGNQEVLGYQLGESEF